MPLLIKLVINLNEFNIIQVWRIYVYPWSREGCLNFPHLLIKIDMKNMFKTILSRQLILRASPLVDAVTNIDIIIIMEYYITFLSHFITQVKLSEVGLPTLAWS